MKAILKQIVCALVLLICSSTYLYSQQLEMTFKEGEVQHVVKASDIQWKPCPPNLPGGCTMAVLEGNPQADTFFTVRFKMNTDVIMPPHTHPKDERVTIIDGKAYVGFGTDATKDKATEFTVGDYYVNARNAVHSVWIEPGTIIQITGIGPWEANFVEK